MNELSNDLIFLEGRQVASFHYLSTDEYIEELKTSFLDGYRKLNVFFMVLPPEIIQIHFLYSKEEMIKHWGKDVLDSLSGMVDNDDQYVIYVYSPMVVEKCCSEKKSIVVPTIIHETAHTFVSALNLRCFYWINEGICQLLENPEIHSKKIKKNDWEWFLKNNAFIDPDLEWPIQAKHGGYKISYNLAEYILKKYGKKAIIDIIKVRREGDQNLIREKFGDVLNCKIEDFLADFESLSFQGNKK